MAQTWLQKYSTYEEEVTGSATGITAYAGGGQANATALTAKFNNVTIVGTDADSVKLPSADIGKKIFIKNSDAAQSLSVYGQSGSYVGGALNGSTGVSAGSSIMFVCIITNYWESFT